MVKENILTSLHGRQLGMNSSGHLVNARDKADQSLYPTANVGNINDNVATTTAGSTAKNYGMTILSSGTATAASFEIEAPAPGVSLELHIATSASEITFGGTATSIIFKPAIGGVGSSLFLSKINNAGGVVQLRGVTTSQYNVIGSTAGMTIG
jgi:hypothetical protein|tara:strand:+ start:1321 stop:1779 length:459 start_codon:yes stop_codon:yes gene_type:complete